MSRLYYLERNPRGPRLYLFGQRVHHGAVGALSAVAVLSIRRFRFGALLALALCFHDRGDLKIWLKREGLPVSAGFLKISEKA